MPPRPPSPLDGEIAAAYAGGLGRDAVAAKLGVSRDTVGNSLRRTGTPSRSRAEGQTLRRRGNAPGGECPQAEYPWAAEAARRNQAGASAHALAIEYGVERATLLRAIARQGVTPVTRPVEGRRSRIRQGDALALRRRWSDRIGELVNRAAESTGQKRAALLARADELEMCERQLREVIRWSAHEDRRR